MKPITKIVIALILASSAHACNVQMSLRRAPRNPPRQECRVREAAC